MLTSQCDHGDGRATRADQHDEICVASRRARPGTAACAGAKRFCPCTHKRYGLTQQTAAEVAGKGETAFSRDANEVSCLNQSTALLLRLAIEVPDVIKALADIAKVDLPIWATRCEDAQWPGSHKSTKWTTPRHRTHVAAKGRPALAIKS